MAVRASAVATYENNPYVKKNLTLWFKDFSSIAVKDVMELTGTEGTLTPEQITKVLDNNLNLEIVVNGKIFTLVNRQSDLTYRTYLNFDVSTSKELEAKALYIQLSPQAVNYGRYTIEDITV